MKESFPPQERIRKKKEFLLLYHKGRRYRGQYFNLIYLPNQLAFSRMAVVVSRKIGKAVVRNKIKRRMRELFRRNKSILTHSLDILLVAKKNIESASWSELREHYLEALGKICPQKNH